MKQFVTAFAALISAAACTSAAQGHEPSGLGFAAAPAVSCDIAVRETRRGAEFEALAFAHAPVDGFYELVLTKQDAGGSADIMQSGEFALAHDEEATLGVAELGLERGARGRAQLTLWRDGAEICRAERRL